jgi:SAM-dependent methyltransferase
MSYVLESQSEGDRLERQSQTPEYDVEPEFSWLEMDDPGLVIELGCGTGVALRHLSERFPQITGIGFDLSSERIREAETLKGNLPLQFSAMNLQDFRPTEALGSRLGDVKLVVARYVLHHLPESLVIRTLTQIREEFPLGTRLIIVEIDGYLANLRPQETKLARDYQRFISRCPVLFHAGSMVQSWAQSTGWVAVERLRQPMAHNRASREREAAQTRERLINARPLLEALFDTERSIQEFVDGVVREFLTEEAQPRYSKAVFELIPC